MLYKVGEHLKTTFEFILITDVLFEILAESPFNQIEEHLKKPYKSWSVVDFSNHLSGTFLGKLIHSNDVFKFAYYYMFYFSENMNIFKMNDLELQKVHKNYINLVYQSNFIIVRPLLMIPLSVLKEEMKGMARKDIVGELYKSKVISDDPMAVIMTNMSPIDQYHMPEMMYSTLGNYFFHAVKPLNDWLVLVFEEAVQLERVVVITGQDASKLPLTTTTKPASLALLFLDNKNESIKQADRNNLELSLAVFESSPHLMNLDADRNLAQCADYRWVGKVGGRVSSLEGLSFHIKRPTKCLKMSIFNDFEDNDIIFRQIAIFTV